MARVKSHHGLIGLITILVVAVVVLPWLIRFVMRFTRSMSGFQDSPVSSTGNIAGGGPMSGGVPSIPSAPNSQYVPDPNTNYICRSPNGNGIPCPEGTFCDGTTQMCQSKSIPSLINSVVGYFS